MPDVLIAWTTADGAEHEERWASVERFRVWALAQGMAAAWRAYAQDGDGEWILADAGEIGRIRAGRP